MVQHESQDNEQAELAETVQTQPESQDSEQESQDSEQTELADDIQAPTEQEGEIKKPKKRKS